MRSSQKQTKVESFANGDVEGEVRINHSVIANIIRISVLEVDGVASVAGGFFGGIAEFCARKDAGKGVAVIEDEDGRYAIEVRVVLYFGSSLAEVAAEIQRNVSRQVAFMTQKSVARVDVLVDGVKVRDGGREKNTEERI
jgi:uncharacterized alkaline shock family protein YloU